MVSCCCFSLVCCHVRTSVVRRICIQPFKNTCGKSYALASNVSLFFNVFFFSPFYPVCSQVCSYITCWGSRSPMSLTFTFVFHWGILIRVLLVVLVLVLVAAAEVEVVGSSSTNSSSSNNINNSSTSTTS